MKMLFLIRTRTTVVFDSRLVGLSPAVVSSAPGLSSPAVSVSVVQSVAFTSPSSPSHGPLLAAPGSAPQSPVMTATRPQVCVVGPGLVPESHCGTAVVQQRLDQTSTSLEAALMAVERKLNLEDNADG